MRTTFDFAPLFRSTVGFDRIFDMLEDASRFTAADSWPPYDIARTGEDDYRITLAVAGFAEDELTIVHEPNLLLVTGQKPGDGAHEYLHRGIAGGSFERRFELADHMQVASARLENGLLTIDLRRELPEAMKPRRIEIARTVEAPAAQRIEAGGKAA